MSITVTLAGNLAEVPEPFYTREDELFVACRVPVNRHVPSGEGERVNDGPTTHDVRILGSAATQLHDGCGSCDSIFVHGLEGTKSWPDKETYESRTEDVVVVANRFGEVGVSLMYVSPRLERAARLAQAS